MISPETAPKTAASSPLEAALGGRLVQQLWQHIPEANFFPENWMDSEVNCYWVC